MPATTWMSDVGRASANTEPMSTDPAWTSSVASVTADEHRQRAVAGRERHRHQLALVAELGEEDHAEREQERVHGGSRGWSAAGRADGSRPAGTRPVGSPDDSPDDARAPRSNASPRPSCRPMVGRSDFAAELLAWLRARRVSDVRRGQPGQDPQEARRRAGRRVAPRRPGRAAGRASAARRPAHRARLRGLRLRQRRTRLHDHLPRRPGRTTSRSPGCGACPIQPASPPRSWPSSASCRPACPTSWSSRSDADFGDAAWTSPPPPALLRAGRMRGTTRSSQRRGLTGTRAFYERYLRLGAVITWSEEAATADDRAAIWTNASARIALDPRATDACLRLCADA